MFPAVLLWLPLELVFKAALWLAAAGLVLGVPAGGLYHLRLYQALRPTGRWWLHPTALHGQLTQAMRGRVMGAFTLGAAGFVLAAGGCVLLFLGSVRLFRGE